MLPEENQLLDYNATDSFEDSGSFFTKDIKDEISEQSDPQQENDTTESGSTVTPTETTGTTNLPVVFNRTITETEDVIISTETLLSTTVSTTTKNNSLEVVTPSFQFRFSEWLKLHTDSPESLALTNPTTLSHIENFFKKVKLLINQTKNAVKAHERKKRQGNY